MVYKNLNHTLLLTPKLLYVFINAQYYTFYGLRAIFLTKKLGLGEDAYSWIVGITQLVTFFTNMLIAFVADKSQKPKLIVIGCMFAAASVFQMFYFDTLTLNSVFMYGLIFLLFTTLMSSVQPIFDRIMLDYLKNDLQLPQTLYGRQRLWGTLSYALTNFIVEAALYRKGEDNLDFGSMAVLELGFAAIAIPMLFYLTPRDRPRALGPRESPKIHRLLKEKEYLFFLSVILLNGISRGAMTHYLSLYYKNSLKLETASKPPAYVPGFLFWAAFPFYKNPIATCSFFGIVLEVAILFISKPLLRNVGLHWPLLLSQFAQCFRFLAYMAISSKTPFKLEVACSIELLKGLNFGLTHISGVQLATRLVPAELKATSQTVYAGTFIGLGAFIGALLGSIFKPSSSRGFVPFFTFNLVCSLLSIVLISVKYGLVDGKLGRNREIIEEERPVAKEPLALGEGAASKKPAAVLQAS